MGFGDGAIGVDGERDDEKAVAVRDAGKVEGFPDVEVAAGGAFDDFSGGAEDLFGFPGHLARELAELAANRVGPALGAAIAQEFPQDRITAEERYREDQQYDFPKHGAV